MQYRDGSFRELAPTALPLMISFLASLAMVFVDRLFLARYSLFAHNAAVTAGTTAWAFVFAIQTMADMSGIFVAQYNGARLLKRLAEPVWQLIWLSLASTLFFVPLAIWGGPLMFGRSEEAALLQNEYFFWMVIAGPLFGVQGALSAFFIGQGRTTLVTSVVVFGNLLNVILDPILIFGWGTIPSLGVAGAAIATDLSLIVQLVILWGLFLQPQHRREHGVLDYRFKPQRLLSYLPVCLPPALFACFELNGWGFFYHMMEARSPTHIAVAGIAQDFAILFLFFGVGLHKGVGTVAGNLIGAGRIHAVRRLLRSGLLMTLGFFVVTIVALVGGADLIVSWFLQKPEISSDVVASGEELRQLAWLVEMGLALTCLFVLFENLRLLFAGLLVAAGDAIHVAIAGVVSIAAFLLLPTYVLVQRLHVSIEVAMGIWVFYGIAAASWLCLRFLSGRWESMNLVEHAQQL